MADDAIIIDLGIDGAQDALQAWREMSRAISRCIDPLRQVAALTAQIAANTQNAAAGMNALAAATPGGSGGGKSGGGGGVKLPGGVRIPKMPALGKTQKIPVPKKPPLTSQQQFSRTIQNLIFSTRVGFGHGGIQIMPLIGRAMQALGKLGPVGLIAAGAIAAVTVQIQLLKTGIERAAAAIKEFIAARYAGGGTAMQTQYGRMLGEAFGANIPELATQFAARISTDPVAAGMVASRTGVRDTGLFGPTNKIQKLLDFIEGLRGLGEEDALRTIRAAGMPEQLMQMRMLPQDQVREMRSMAGMSGQIYDSKTQQDVVAFQAGLAELASAIKDLVVSVFGPYLPYITRLLREWATGIQRYALWLKQSGIADFFAKLVMWTTPFGLLVQLGTALGIVWNSLQTAFYKLIAWLLGAVDWITNAATRGHGTTYRANFERSMRTAQEAQDRNTEALNANTQAMQGMYGGGERARAYMPAHWQNNAWAPNRQPGWEGATRLGAFNV